MDVHRITLVFFTGVFVFFGLSGSFAQEEQSRFIEKQINYSSGQTALGNQSFNQQTRLLSGVSEQGSFFGDSSAISGSTVIVGAPAEGSQSQGAAYIYTRIGATWTEPVRVSGVGGNEAFGNSVDIQGDTAVVGAPDAFVGSNNFQGAVYIFTRTGGTWTRTAILTASDGLFGDKFGSTVQIDGNRIVVSAIYDDEV